MRVVVTGGTGKAGRWVVADLRAHGHDVLNVDSRHDGSPHGQCLVADLADYGQAAEAVAGADAVVHLAAIPAPEIRPAAETFRINALSTYNVFAAAVAGGVRRVAWASSETVLGLPFDIPPAFAPIDETIEPRPESSYALSKLVGETMATQFSRRSGIPFVGLRISNIMEPDDYAEFPTYWADARLRRWNLWGYVDCRDVAQACRLALEAKVTGAPRLHRRRGRYRDDPPLRGSHGRGLPRRAAHPSPRGPRDAAGDRPCADAPGVRPSASVVGPRGVPRVAGERPTGRGRHARVMWGQGHRTRRVGPAPCRAPGLDASRDRRSRQWGDQPTPVMAQAGRFLVDGLLGNRADVSAQTVDRRRESRH